LSLILKGGKGRKEGTYCTNGGGEIRTPVDRGISEEQGKGFVFLRKKKKMHHCCTSYGCQIKTKAKKKGGKE